MFKEIILPARVVTAARPHERAPLNSPSLLSASPDSSQQPLDSQSLTPTTLSVPAHRKSSALVYKPLKVRLTLKPSKLP